MKRPLMAALTAGVLVVASACGGSSPSTGSGDDGGPPKPGGTLNIAMPSDGTTLDPHESPSFNTQERVGMTYGRLLRHKIGPDQPYGALKLEPDLATSWDISEDGLTYTFHLREGVKWQNVAPVNGREFVADDVIATFERIREKGFQVGALGPVTKMTAKDDHTVELKLSKPFAPLLNNMADQFMWIIPKEGAEGKFELQTKAIGTGPFILEKWERNVAATYKKNPDYWEKGKPYLDRVVFKVVPDQGARIAAYRSGETQLVGATTDEEAVALERSVAGTRVLNLLSGTPVNLFLNVDHKPLDDVRVRKALSMAIQRKSMKDAIFKGGQYGGPVAVSLKQWALPDAELAQLQPTNPTEAKRLLAEAGYPNGLDLKLMVTQGYGPLYPRVAEWLVEDFAKIGVRAKIEVVEYATYFTSRWPKQQYEMSVGPQTPFLEPDYWLRDQLHSDGPRNWMGVNDPKLDKMVEEQTQIMDPKERAEKIKEIQRYVLEQALPPVQVWNHPTKVLLHQEVKRFHPQPEYGYPELRETWLAQQ
ncbi:MAG: ABC transporter substrate-binding protein [Streptosporangiales bacterium]|nr:ABC transporter substrate-binding protein [Streptosporangiales bacterium]